MLTDTDSSVIEDPAAVLDPPEGTDTSGETPAGAEHAEGGAEGGEDDLDGVVVTIGDEQPAPEDTEQSAPSWVKDLRKANRQKDRELREKDAEIARLRGAGQQAQAVVLGEKPDPSDFETWTEEGAAKFTAALESWVERKASVARQEQQRQDAEKNAQANWQKRLDAFASGKAALKVSDFEEAEAAVQETFDVVQQGILLKAAAKSATFVYALWKSPATLKRLAAIKDPIDFAWAASKVEDKVNVTERRAAPVPERVLRSSAPTGAFNAKQLEDLRAKCLETGNMDPYYAAKRAAQAKRA